MSNFNNYQITKDQAMKAALRLNVADTKQEQLSFTKNTIQDLKEIKDSKNRTCLYIINFSNNKGFVILSADTRCKPLLAHADEGYFDTEHYKELEGLDTWLNISVDNLSLIKDEIEKPTIKPKNNYRTLVDSSFVDTTLTWTTLNADSIILSLPMPDDWGIVYNPDDYVPTASLFKRGPLLPCVWGQKYPFNYYCPQQTVITTDFRYAHRAPAGCVAIAIAQVMKKWNHPNTYNWSIMPNSVSSIYTPSPTNIPTPTAGQLEMARLIKNIGTDVSMNYGTTTSSAFPFRVSDCFKHFGYSNEVYRSLSYNYSQLKSDLNVGRPVIMCGAKNTFSGGHCWVVDGIWEYSNGGYLNWEYLHMNWGWTGYNGWYDPDTHQLKVNDDGSVGDDHYENFSHWVSVIYKIYKP